MTKDGGRTVSLLEGASMGVQLKKGEGYKGHKRGELHKGRCHMAVVPNKAMVEIVDSQKLLELFKWCRFGPLCHHSYLFGMCLYLPASNNVPQETDRIGMEFTFFSCNK